jgi:hypothetical protein
LPPALSALVFASQIEDNSNRTTTRYKGVYRVLSLPR